MKPNTYYSYADLDSLSEYQILYCLVTRNASKTTRMIRFFIYKMYQTCQFIKHFVNFWLENIPVIIASSRMT